MMRLITVAILFCLIPVFTASLLGQVEVMPWGNVTGIRVEGQLADLETCIALAKPGWEEVLETAKEVQQPRYSREGSKHIITTKIETVSFQEIVEDRAPGSATISLQLTAEADTSMAGAYLGIMIPQSLTSEGKLQLIKPRQAAEIEIPLANISTRVQDQPIRFAAAGVRFVSPDRRWEIKFDDATEMTIRKAPPEASSTEPRLYVALSEGNVVAGQTATKSLSIRTSGRIDRSPARLVLDVSRPGNLFQGMGGNFRIQNPRVDPAVIQYNLENMRVAWGRVEMPWRFWHPNEEDDPIRNAETNGLDRRVQAAMEMARTLARRKIPVIVSAWSAPAWAIDGTFSFRPQPGMLRGNPLKADKTQKIYESIGAYLVYLKRVYGVEAAMFSFNESDLGINVRQTGEEHAALIKGLGAYLAKCGLATKMLLGDNSDATTTEFILPAMHDPEARPYIGAVSFHSWRGWSDELLKFWGEAARRLNVPLLVGEGSTDAAAWSYPQVFKEPWFAMQEITLYTRICAISQPLSILQWQLTADYSILAGGGVFREEGPLRPTRRFWHLKQLASTGEDSFALPIHCERPDITCAAFGNIAEGIYTIHVVNNGPSRAVTLEGLPSSVKSLKVYVTDDQRGMEEKAGVKVKDGKIELTLDPVSFTTIFAEISAEPGATS